MAGSVPGLGTVTPARGGLWEPAGSDGLGPRGRDRTRLVLHKGSRPALCLDLGWPLCLLPGIALQEAGTRGRGGPCRSCGQSHGGRGTGEGGGAGCSAALKVTFGRRPAWAH